MKMSEFYESIVEDALDGYSIRVESHAPWMADILIRLKDDPAFKKLTHSTREEIERVLDAIE